MWLSTNNVPVNRFLNNDVLSLFEDAIATSSQRWQPAVDIQEVDQQFLLAIDVPGITDEALEISVESNVLTISGKREARADSEQQQVYRAERHQGEFKRVFKLPTSIDVENIKANKKDGVLNISIPKKAQASAKKITINK